MNSITDTPRRVKWEVERGKKKLARDELEMERPDRSKPVGRRAEREERRCEEGSKDCPTLKHMEPLEGQKEEDE